MSGGGGMMDDMAKHVIPEYDDDERELFAIEESWADCHRPLRTGVRARVKSGIGSYRGGLLVQVGATLKVYRDEFEGGRNRRR